MSIHQKSYVRTLSITLFGAFAAFAMTSAIAQNNPLRLGPAKSKKDVSPNEVARPSDKANLFVEAMSSRSVDITPKAGESNADAWISLFASRKGLVKDVAFDAGVRTKVRQLVAKQDFQQIQELISAALKNDAMQPWMYEALALALEASKAPESEIERVVLSAVDVSRDAESALTAAGYLASLKLDRAALRLFQDVASQDPLRTEPYLQALKCAENLKDAAAIRWCCVGILKQAWPSDQKEVEQYARRVAEATIAQLEKNGHKKEAAAFQAEFAQASARDIRVRVWWTGDADIDLSVLEPTGEVCSYRNPRTTGGGVILGDTFSRSSVTAPRDGFSETFLCPEGFTGQYQVLLKRVWGEVAGGKVNVEVITHYGSKNEQSTTREVPIAKDGTVFDFPLLEGRRKEALSEARAVTATNRQIEVARHVLAQQIPSGSSGSASGEAYFASNAPLVIDPRGRLAFPLNRGAVGFRPQLTTLQDGPSLQAGPAVVSADRRFVRMTLAPNFNTIGEVQTFNFASGAVGNGNGSGNTPGTGGGQGGGGGVGT